MKTTPFAILLLSIFTLLSTTVQASFSIHCPDDVWVSCEEELWDLSSYGNATYTLHYHTYDAGQPSVTYNLNSCNVGVIYRTWTVEDEHWNMVSCTQTIHVSGTNNGVTVQWPEQLVSVQGCNPDVSPGVTGTPTYYANSPCSLVGVNYEDIVFTFSPQCKKIKRKWKVIDWCTYDGNPNYGIQTFEQIIKISESSEPTYTALDTVFARTTNCYNAYVYIPTPHLDPSECGGDFVIYHSSAYADTTGVNASGTYPIGTHNVRYRVDYGCGLKKYIYQTVVVEDASRPVPYCLASITTALMPVDNDNDGIPEDGMVEIWAKDFDYGSYSPCGYGPVSISFSADVDSMSAVFDCSDVGVNLIEMWVTDRYGNADYCVVELEIQNNAANIPDCQPQSELNTIAGNISLVDGSHLEQASVQLRAMQMDTTLMLIQDTLYTKEVQDSFLLMNGGYAYTYEEVMQISTTIDTVYAYQASTDSTDVNGVYEISSVVQNKAYSLSSSRQSIDINNITYQDALILSRHLQGLTEITDSLQLLAADINADGNVDYDDFYTMMYVVRLRKFPNTITDYWRIFDKAKYLETAEISEEIYVMMDDTLMQKDMLAVLKGDLTIFEQNDAVLSPSVVSYRDSESSETMIYPSPFRDQLTMVYHSEQKTKGSLKLFEITGEMLHRQDAELTNGLNVISLDGLNMYPDGIYYLQLVDVDGNILNFSKVVK